MACRATRLFCVCAAYSTVLCLAFAVVSSVAGSALLALVFGVASWAVFRFPSVFVVSSRDAMLPATILAGLACVLVLLQSRTVPDAYDRWRLVSAGERAFRVADYEKAAEWFAKGVDGSPQSLRAVYNLAVSAHRAQEYPLARDAYVMCIQIDPMNVEAFYNLAAVSEILGATTDQIVALTRLISIDATHADGLFALGRALILQEDYETAYALLLRARDLYPEGTRSHRLTEELLEGLRLFVRVSDR